MTRLEGRVALVTGVSRRAGIGFAIARRLLGDGCSVFAQDWTPHDATQQWGADTGTSACIREARGRLGPGASAARTARDPSLTGAFLPLSTRLWRCGQGASQGRNAVDPASVRRGTFANTGPVESFQSRVFSGVR